MKKILLTGGGTAGHVTPNIAMLDTLKKEGFEAYYIGSHKGMEKNLIADTGIPYHAISSGKLRRYKDLKNLTDPFKVIKGCFEAAAYIRKLKPDVVFSKGGFVSVPVIIGAWINRVPSILHESDMTPGLANKLSIPFATKVCANFSETINHLPKGKAVLTGTPIRESLLHGDVNRGLALCGFEKGKPVILLMGGSLGAKKLNECLRKVLPELLKSYQVVHLCGKGNVDQSLLNIEGYRQFEYAKEELPHLFAVTDVIVSRAGANAIFEFLTLKKPSLLIPLSSNASRGDQILNARSFEAHGFSKVLLQEDLNEESLVGAIEDLYKNRERFVERMGTSEVRDGVMNVVRVVKEVVG